MQIAGDWYVALGWEKKQVVVQDLFLEASKIAVRFNANVIQYCKLQLFLYGIGVDAQDAESSSVASSTSSIVTVGVDGR